LSRNLDETTSREEHEPAEVGKINKLLHVGINQLQNVDIKKVNMKKVNVKKVDMKKVKIEKQQDVHAKKVKVKM
jgi:hypothetical protein